MVATRRRSSRVAPTLIELDGWWLDRSRHTDDIIDKSQKQVKKVWVEVTTSFGTHHRHGVIDVKSRLVGTFTG